MVASGIKNGDLNFRNKIPHPAAGVVKGIDLESKKITIHHDPIAAVNWPEMTMRFTITPQTKMSEIKTGDKVAFNFVQQGNLSLLQDIKVSQ
ncbi:cation efflux system protein CusF [Escherichia sp. SS-MK2]